MSPEAIVPDPKDWTWTLQRTCPECGYSAGAVTGPEIAGEALRLTRPWAEVLERDDARTRPAPGAWSPLEYAAHVRDVCRVFLGRVEVMLREDDPPFESWDQDAAAVEGHYAEQDPATVAAHVDSAAARLARAFLDLDKVSWDRTGRRSDGHPFTVRSLGQYCLHELAHHLLDARA